MKGAPSLGFFRFRIDIMAGMNQKMTIQLCVTLVGIVLLHTAAIYFHWYWEVSWFDIFMHLISGIWVGVVGILLFAQDTSLRNAFCIALLSALAVGLLWELYEYATGMTFTLSSYPIDTSTDLLMDLVGAAGGFISMRKHLIAKSNG